MVFFKIIKKFILLSFLFFNLYIFLNTTILAQNTATTSSNISPDREENILLRRELEDKINELRSENYQHAIKVAEDAGSKADRLLNWLVAFFTITGVTLTIATYLVGKDFSSKLKDLNKHLQDGKKNANLIAEIARKAENEGEKLKSIITEIDTTFLQYKKELLESKKSKESDIKNLEKKIEQLKASAEGTISDITMLKNSATILANPSPYYDTVSPSGGTINLFEPEGVAPVGAGLTEIHTCKNCGKFISDFETPLTATAKNEKICEECKNKISNPI